MKSLLVTLLLLVIGATAGWWLRARLEPAPHSAGPSDSRKIAYYQSPMHPWIRSDKPGKCTICGMDLTPIYEGEKGFDNAEGLIALPTSSIQVIGVATVPVQRAPIARSLRVAGTIDDDARRHRLLTAWVGGRIEKLFVNYVGAEVREGQPLARLYSPTLITVAREYRMLARSDRASGGLLASARRRLERLGLTPAQIDALPDTTEETASMEIIAPVSGTVVSRDVYEGQYVEEGARLFEIGDFSTMWFVFDVYERDLDWLAVGQEVEVTVRARPGRVWKAPITFIDPNLNETTRSARVRVDLPNPLLERNGRRERELLHRLYAEGRVRLTSPPALSLPRTAVLHTGKQAFVFLDRGGGAYERRAIRIGRIGDDRAEVLDGLAEGDRVVTQGNLLLDAQSELMRNSPDAAGEAAAKDTRPADRSVELPAELLELTAELSATLAADDLPAYLRAAHRSHDSLAVVIRALAADPAGEPFAARLRAVGSLPPADDLKAARKAFHDFSAVVADLLLTTPPGNTGLRVFESPMTADAFPGAPVSARWVQRDPHPRNPYFGQPMLDCGTEVKR